MSNADPSLAEAVESLARQLWGPEVALRALDRIAGDASSRSYFRARLEGPAPPSIVVMKLHGSSLSISSDELQTLAERPKEEPFVNVHRYMAKIGVPVPALYHEDPERNIILLEDLGNRLLWEEACQGTPQQMAHLYRRAIDVMVTIHVRGTHSPDPTCIAFAQRFDERLFMWELDHFIEFGIERRLGIALDSFARHRLSRHFALISAKLAEAPAVLSHRDFHSWNIIVRHGALYLIDFQDALLAPAPYDLASLLTDRATSALVTPQLEAELAGYYLTERKRREREAGRDFDAQTDEFRQLYFLAVLQRALKVIGRFYFLALEKGKTDYLRFIAAEVSQVRRAIEQASFDCDLVSAFNSYPWPEEERACGHWS